MLQILLTTINNWYPDNRIVNIKILFLTTLLGSVWLPGFSQNDIQNLIPASPEAASFGKYVDLPVTAYTGTPGISVPITVLKDKSLSLPVSLSYHHKGLQVETEASRVGLGWSLSVGGAITRTVKGEPDDKGGMVRYDQVADIQNQDTHEFLEKVEKGLQDGAPDVYSFNFAGKTGRFVIYQGQARFFSYSRIKITQAPGGGLFTVVDEDGTTYIFAATEQTTSLSGYVPQQDITSYTSAWYLTQIVSADQTETITLHYNNTSHTISKSVESYQFGVGSHCTKPSTFTPVETTIDGKELAYIESSLMRVVFENATQNRLDIITKKALNTIKVYNKQDLNNPVRTVQLQHGYFGNNVHLKLLTVTEFGKHLQAKPPYSFEYHEELTVPTRDSKSQDHWGFYNGAINSTLIPKVSDQQPYGNADRSPNFEATRTTVLKKMRYPTGGWVTFDYEQNHYENGEFQNTSSVRDAVARGSLSPTQGTSGIVDYATSFQIKLSQNVNISYQITRHNVAAGGKDEINDIELKNAQGVVVWSVYTEYNAQAEQGINANVLQQLPIGNYTLTIRAAGGDDISASINYQTYDNKVITRKMGPGLRVKRVRHYDNLKSEPALTKEYQYEGGILQIPNQSYTGSYNSSFRVVVDPTDPDSYVCLECNFTQVSTSPKDYRYFSPYGHYALVYTKVIEFTGENGAGGKSITLYDIPDQEDFSNVTAKRQDLYAFEPTQNTFRLIKTTDYTYQQVTDATFATVEVRVLSNNSCTVDVDPIKTYFKESHNLLMRWRYLTKTSDTSYDDQNQVMSNETVVQYSSLHRYPQEVTTTNSKGEKRISRKKYPEDYTSNIAGFLVNQNILGIALEEQSWQEKNGVQTLLGGRIVEIHPTYFKPYKVYALEINEPLSSLDQESQTGGLYNTILSDSRYQLKATFGFDQEGNVNLQQKQDDVDISYLWGYNKKFPIARATNAAPDQIFHTSFEDVTSLGNVLSNDSYTGQKSWQGAYTIPDNQKPIAGNYVVTYWEKTSTQWVFRKTNVSYNPTTNATLIDIANPIDEVRMYPAQAQMTTYTFDEVFGMTTNTDINGRPTHYVYDVFGRLSATKDYEKNILKKYQYIYQQD